MVLRVDTAWSPQAVPTGATTHMLCLPAHGEQEHSGGQAGQQRHDLGLSWRSAHCFPKAGSDSEHISDRTEKNIQKKLDFCFRERTLEGLAISGCPPCAGHLPSSLSIISPH